MKLGSQEEKSTALHLIKGTYSIPKASMKKYYFGNLSHSSLYSYLKSLVPSFNECADKFIQGLRPLADGKTTVPMKEHLAEVTLDVISKVGYELLHSMNS